MNKRTQAWSLVALLCVANAIAYIDRTNLSIALASQEFRKLFSLTDVDRGHLNSAFFWSYALLQIPAGALADRWGVRVPYAAGFLLWSVVSAAMGAVDAVWQILVLRLLLGVGEAILTPGALRWIRFHIPEQQRGLATGLFFAGAKLGPTIGAPLAAKLIVHLGWRAMFTVLGLASLLWLIPWLALTRENEGRKEQRREEARSVPLSTIFREPAIYGIVIATFAYNYFNYFCLTWLPSYFVEHWKLSLNQSGAFTSFSFGGFAIVAVLAGWTADQLIKRGWNVVKVRKGFTLAGLLLASAAALGPLSSSREFALTMAIVSLTSLGLTTANYWALTQSIMPPAAIGRITGVQNFASNLSGVFAAEMTGFFITWTGSYRAPILACSALLLIGAIAYAVLVRPPAPIDGIEQEQRVPPAAFEPRRSPV